VQVGEEAADGVTCIVQNSDPYSYFGDRPIRICDGAGFQTGSIGVTVLRRATLVELPTLIPRVFSGRAQTVVKGRQVRSFGQVKEAVVSSLDGRPFPLQLDGEFIGEFESVRYGVRPRALAVVS
jgi:diacylglycerol kinase family enzyme